jgi:hypothetical protein
MRRSRRSASAAVPTSLAAIRAGLWPARELSRALLERVSVSVTFVAAHCCRRAPRARHDHHPHAKCAHVSALLLCVCAVLSQRALPSYCHGAHHCRPNAMATGGHAMPAGQSHARGPEPCPRARAMPAGQPSLGTVCIECTALSCASRLKACAIPQPYTLGLASVAGWFIGKLRSANVSKHASSSTHATRDPPRSRCSDSFGSFPCADYICGASS